MSSPIAFFLTWSTYGTHLHGDPRGSWDDKGGRNGARYLEPLMAWERHDERAMVEPPFVMDISHRRVVDETIRAHVAHRAWHLHALNVRTNHVHVIVSGAPSADKAMAEFKAWSTRRLREANLVGTRKRIWTEHGSTVWLWKESTLAEKIDYVVNGQ